MKLVNISRLLVVLSLTNTLLVLLTSILGITNPITYHKETSNWAMQAIGQDIANLIVVALLFGCTYFLTKNSFRAYLIWLGSYIYLIYSFVIYAFFIHFNYLFLIYLAILSLSVFLPIVSLFNLNFKSLPSVFNDRIKVKPVSILLMTIGILFFVLWLSEIIPSLLSGKTPASLMETGLWVNPVHVLDLSLLLPAMIITSVFLWKRRLLGYFLAVPMLVFSATMGIGIISLFILISTNDNLTIPPPAFAIILIVALSTYFSFTYLRSIKPKP